MKWPYTIAVWCFVVGVGGGVGNGLYIFVPKDVSVLFLGACAIVLTVSNSFAFQKFRKTEEMNSVGWMDARRRNKVRRFVSRRTSLFYARWPACIGFGILTFVLAGLLKLSDTEYDWLLTVCGYGSGTLLILLAVLMSHDYIFAVRLQADILQQREDRERRRLFLQKVKT